MDEKANNFLKDLEDATPNQAKIIKTLRQKILELKPDLTESIMYGGLVFKDGSFLYAVAPSCSLVLPVFCKDLLIEPFPNSIVT
jgi:hypothetical protein